MKSLSPSTEKRSFSIYQMSTVKDYFYNHTNRVLIGFLASVAAILVLLMFAFWIGYEVW